MMRQSPKPYAKGKEGLTPLVPGARSIAKAGTVCPLSEPWTTEFRAGD
jgi:hypothetical protein